MTEIRAEDLFDRVDLACGCMFARAVVDGVATFVAQPCSLTCPSYVAAVEASDEAGHPLEFRHQARRL